MTSKLANITREVLEPVWMRRDIRTETVAQRLGVTRAGLSAHAKKLGLPSRAGNQTPNHRGDEMLRRLWEAGVSTSEIARYLGYSNSGSVSFRARAIGLAPRRTGTRNGFRGEDGQWRKHTPIEDVLHLQERLGQAMLAEARGTR